MGPRLWGELLLSPPTVRVMLDPCACPVSTSFPVFFRCHQAASIMQASMSRRAVGARSVPLSFLGRAPRRLLPLSHTPAAVGECMTGGSERVLSRCRVQHLQRRRRSVSTRGGSPRKIVLAGNPHPQPAPPCTGSTTPGLLPAGWWWLPPLLMSCRRSTVSGCLHHGCVPALASRPHSPVTAFSAAPRCCWPAADAITGRLSQASPAL